MPDKDDAKVVPSGYSRVDPWVISRDTDAEIEFLRRAFGAGERPNSRVLNADVCNTWLRPEDGVADGGDGGGGRWSGAQVGGAGDVVDGRR
jgi:hypothetical protein